MIRIKLEELVQKFIIKIQSKKVLTDPSQSISITINNTNIDLLHRTQNIQIFPKCFFSQKNTDLQYLGFGLHKKYSTNEDISLIDFDIEKYPELAIMGGKSFFDNDRPSEWKDLSHQFFFMPKLQFKRENKNVNASIIFDNNDLARQDMIVFLNTLISNETKTKASTGIIKSFNKSSFPLFESYTTKAIKNIKKTSLKKVVIARKETRDCDSKESIKKILMEWNNEVHNHYYFLIQTSSDHAFLSVTPERLFLLEKDHIIIDSIAGTRPRSENLREDSSLAEELLTDQKELEEHEYVSSSIENGLGLYAKNIQKTKNKEILKLKNVQHIFSQYSAKTIDNTNRFDLLKEFHPTPAVGGFPKKMALDFIQNNENFTRGLYAAPIGIISKKTTDLAVGIRSVLVSEDTVHIYAGCGIVETSNAKNEWLETKNKMDNFSSLL